MFKRSYIGIVKRDSRYKTGSRVDYYILPLWAEFLWRLACLSHLRRWIERNVWWKYKKEVKKSG